MAEEHLDVLYAFFQNCNHLADWIINDSPPDAPRVRQLVVETVELRICRDICNATKHFTLDRPPRVDGGFADGSEYVPQGWPTDYPVVGRKWFVIAAGQKWDVFDLADGCMRAWDSLAMQLSPIAKPADAT